MTTIKLSEKQKNKLLEMCKKLFPKLDICLTGQSGRAWDAKNPCFINIWNIKDGEKLIHWFEFCMTELSQKLSVLDKTPNPKNALDLNHFLVGVMYKTIHPVDYLYNKFKKLT